MAESDTEMDMRDGDAIDEEHMMYGHGAMTEQELDEKFPNDFACGGTRYSWVTRKAVLPVAPVNGHGKNFDLDPHGLGCPEKWP